MRLKKLIVLSFILFLAVAVFLSVRFFGGNEDIWICESGVWKKHGNPSAEMPKKPCGIAEEKIYVFSPVANETVDNIFVVEGKARGYWFFEASFPVKVVDEKGNILGGGIATAGADWMTEELVPFRAVVEIKPDTAKEGRVILIRDNPSGLPQYNESIEIPVKFSGAEKILLNVFFGNDVFNPGAEDCSAVYPVKRIVNKTVAPARAALTELLKGPEEEDKKMGFYTSLNSGVKILGLSIKDKIIYAEFDGRIEEGVGGSCRVTAIRSQITKTLSQFSGIEDVVISVDGKTEEALQP